MTIISFVTWFLTDLSHAAITAGTLCSGEGKRLPISCRRVGATILTYIYTCVNMRSVAGPAFSLRYGVPTPFVGCGWVVLLVLRVCSTGTTTSTSTSTSTSTTTTTTTTSR